MFYVVHTFLKGCSDGLRLDDSRILIIYQVYIQTRSQVFEQTIPNSAVVINPNPLNEPSHWRAFIYVTPSSAMLETGIVLSVVFALLAILVGLLHLKEKREDQKEKLVEMQRFHFDAM